MAGAEAVAITSMGGHFCVAEFETVSPLPILNAIPAIDKAIRQRGSRTLGILGTNVVMRTRLHGGVPSSRIVPPRATISKRSTRPSYAEMAAAARVTEAQRGVFFAVGQRLCREQGAEAILGGTDLFLAFDGRDAGFPVIDCAASHLDPNYQASIA